MSTAAEAKVVKATVAHATQLDGLSVLGRFSPATREWFGGAFAAPTDAQLGAWNAVSEGAHALVVAPTGSGKTLAAFLWAIDQLIAHPVDAESSAATVPAAPENGTEASSPGRGSVSRARQAGAEAAETKKLGTRVQADVAAASKKVGTRVLY